jgi:hypothetical protein
MVAQIDHFHVDIVPLTQPINQPSGRFLGESTGPSRTDNDLNKRIHERTNAFRITVSLPGLRPLSNVGPPQMSK